ncbi:ABC transporter substrate-binding protein [Duganella sp. HH101]|uniref:substrate-binding periplasmic protein n=1 Tax=Duganella sp. HH101 TaxID=1781066 RepID=UPI000875925A|nr:ABC transporter substrate-binding protein [Duganella sp. HH101]OEZ99084.1 bacterial extracellular solute-binding protein, family 3 [Duganella sp. HH101]
MNRVRIFLAATWALAGPAGAANVAMAFGDNLPPFILAGEDAGIEVDLVREALAYRGHVLQARYLPMGRIPVSFKARAVDAIMMDVGVDMTPHGGHYGTPPVIYDNVFYTLKRSKLAIRRPEDLQGHTVIAFVGAAARYPVWLQPLTRGPGYVESNHQEAQPLLLALGRYDIALSDRSIFQYYTRLQRKRQPGFEMPPVDEHSFIRADGGDYRPVFRSAAIRDDFNAGLAHLHKTGRYRAIYDKYLKD